MKRRRPNRTEIAAAALLQVKRGDDWLIPEPLRSTGSAEEIVRYCEYHHKHMYTFGGDTSPQNITPLAPLEHKRETIRLRPQITKTKRQEKKIEEARRQMLAKDTGELVYVKNGKRKQLTQYTRLKHIFKRKLTGKVVLRSEDERGKR